MIQIYGGCSESKWLFTFEYYWSATAPIIRYVNPAFSSNSVLADLNNSKAIHFPTLKYIHLQRDFHSDLQYTQQLSCFYIVFKIIVKRGYHKRAWSFLLLVSTSGSSQVLAFLDNQQLPFLHVCSSDLLTLNYLSLHCFVIN